MSLIVRPAPDDEPAVTSPELQRLVLLARDYPLPPLRVDAAAIHAGFVAARDRRRAAFATGGLLAAGLAALSLVRPDVRADEPPPPAAQIAEAIPSPPPAREAPALATHVRIEPRGDAPAPAVRGPHAVDLAPGSYVVVVDPHTGDEPLRVRTTGGELEIRHGRVDIRVAADHTEATLIDHGVATWIAPRGERRPLPVVDERPTSRAPATPDASALARRAEARMTAGDRPEAIKLLTRIVVRHADDPAARTALLDLAGQLKAEGRVDEAYCAYRLYLDRYPGKEHLAPDVGKALSRLSHHPRCIGLRPR